MKQQAYTHRLLARAVGRERVQVGEAYLFPVDRRILYAWPALSDQFASLIDVELDGIVPELDNLYMVFDHMMPVKSQAQHRFVTESVEWCRSKGIRISQGEGIGHILAIEQEWVASGMVVAHFDTHVASVGAIGALGLGLLNEFLLPLATNRIWLEIPPILRVELQDALPPGVMGRDLLHTLVREYGPDCGNGKIIEFGGPGASTLPLEDRITICNLINYLGAISGVFDVEPEVESSGYAKTLSVNLPDVIPCYAAPSDTSHARYQEEVAGARIDIGIIGTCAGGGLNDIATAAKILANRRVKEGCSLYVIPSTTQIYREALRLGYIDILLRAGAFFSSPTCDFCYGAAVQLGEGMTAISTQTLNVCGRLGSLDASIYLGSPAAVAAAMIEGEIVDPRDYFPKEDAI